ncbi:putative epoxide hydrolase [Venustampulla echinocandica]|uniref:Putative epoxide hydrolase n=1 Tax=Venustampulla echinocandica TaxID=2656787 RepID=A0A370TJH6_9HELO|nr:putative epoxide hydrolase [Venustampulla echinocandica]RDL35681.1 putative epoxide hydrolase [Venustampulla echinocandica]
MDPSIKPFKISVPDSAIDTLKAKLASTTFPDEVPLADSWDYGTPLTDMKRLVKFWSDGFDWRAQEKRLNELPQFTTKIDVDGFEQLDIHFVHRRSKREGRPGSFIEVTKIISLLTDGKPDGPSFHVVAPSLPNFGFSQAPSKPGFGLAQYAEVNHKLMLKLGYDKYATQGGDWGWSINRMMGVRYPSHVVASHFNYVPADRARLTKCLDSLSSPLTEQEKEGVVRSEWFYDKGFGYNYLQSTRPSTLGFALRDSPTALLSWIYEKLHDWTDCYPWTDDEILTWISIYQFSRAGPEASLRIYYEAVHMKPEERSKVYEYNKDVKLGLSYFPRDVIVAPSAYGRTMGPVVYEIRHPDGGHFAAYERPELLVGDLRKMFGEEGRVMW